MRAGLLILVLIGTLEPVQDVREFEKRVGEVVVKRVREAPVVDGSQEEGAWKDAREYSIGVDIPKKVLSPSDRVLLKAVHDGEFLYVRLRWRDKTKSDRHLPYVWNRNRRAYDEAEDLEDAAYLAFELKGPFNVNMRAGIDAVWDVWYWQAARTNPVGHALDATHRYSRAKPKEKARFVKLVDNRYGYIRRSEDEGTPIRVKLPAPDRYRGKTAPHFRAQAPTGSAADVRAKGIWRNGWWTVEFKRKLDTGNKDDTPFLPGKGCGFAAGIAREGEDEDHLISRAYTLRFER